MLYANYNYLLRSLRFNQSINKCINNTAFFELLDKTISETTYTATTSSPIVSIATANQW